MKISISLEQGLLALSIILAVILGGQVSIQTLPILPGEFLAGLSGGELPQFAHAIAGIPVVIAAAILLIKRRVIPLPAYKITLALLAFVSVLLISVAMSNFKFASLQSWTEWATYTIAFFTATAVCGRDKGPRLMLQCAVGAGSLVALKGIAEYASMRSTDPSWRIFADYNNPNALAGLFLLLIFPALGLMMSGQRIERFLCGLSATLMMFALMLTQSKGGLIALVIGLISLVVVAGIWGGIKRCGLIILPLLAVAIMVVGMRPGSMSRVSQAGETTEQSSGFRSLLWKSAIQLAKDSPEGTGLGTFRHESARPGLNTQTVMAHNSFLQLAVEGGVLAIGLLFLTMLLWIREIFRGARSMPVERNVLRAGVTAAIIASCAHSFVDSDLYVFGIGMLFFALLGIGLQLANDASAPELTPRPMRLSSALLGIVIGITSLTFGYLEYSKASVLGRMSQPGALDELKAIPSLGDGDLEYLKGLWSARMGEPGKQYFEQAAELAPSMKHLRAWARVQAKGKDYVGAEGTLRKALQSDPNNLLTFEALRELLVTQDKADEAKNVAEQEVLVEQTSYFKVRSLPELIPTETASARVYLAKSEPDLTKRAKLLQEALDRYLLYRKITVPRILQADPVNSGLGFGGETLAEAKDKMTKAKEVALQLAELYRSLKELERAKEAELAVERLEIEATSAP